MTIAADFEVVDVPRQLGGQRAQPAVDEIHITQLTKFAAEIGAEPDTATIRCEARTADTGLRRGLGRIDRQRYGFERTARDVGDVQACIGHRSIIEQQQSLTIGRPIERGPGLTLRGDHQSRRGVAGDVDDVDILIHAVARVALEGDVTTVVRPQRTAVP